MKTQEQYELRILRAIRRITRSIALHSRQLAAYNNITAPQLVCLGTVIEKGPLPLHKLVARCMSAPVRWLASSTVLRTRGLSKENADAKIVVLSLLRRPRQAA